MARPGLEPRAFRWPCEHSTTELPSHPAISPTTFHLNPTPVTHFPGLFKFAHEFSVEKSTNFLYPFATDIQTKLPLRSCCLCWEPFVTGGQLWLNRSSNPGPFADRANTLPLSYRATRSSHQQLFTWNLPRLHELCHCMFIVMLASNLASFTIQQSTPLTTLSM